MPDVRLVIKCHPAESGAPYERAAGGAANVTIAPASADLARLVAAASLLVTVNSTAAIEAMPLDVPALVVALPNNLSPFVEAGAVAGAAMTAKSARMLRALLYDQKFRDRLGEGRRAFMARYGIAADGRAAGGRPVSSSNSRRTDPVRSTRHGFGDCGMRALITGGAGFVGSHLADRLLELGHEVFVLDNLSTGSIDNIAHLKEHRQFHYTIDSVTNEPVLAELVDQADVVFHLAAAVGVKLIVEQPVHTIETNVQGTEVVLTHANKKKKLVIIASTSEVYGKNTAVPFSEEADLVLGPTTKHRWAYACSKAIDEFLALAYWKEKKLPVIVVRLFNTVGPRQTGQYGMVIPNFVRQALAGQPITVFGDGTQTRSFTYVGDVVDALATLAQEPAAIGRVFNIGNSYEISIRELAERVKALTGSASEIVTIPYDEAYEAGFEDMPRRVPDISRIHHLIGYEPRVQLDEILERVIDYFRTR